MPTKDNNIIKYNHGEKCNNNNNNNNNNNDNDDSEDKLIK